MPVLSLRSLRHLAATVPLLLAALSAAAIEATAWERLARSYAGMELSAADPEYRKQADQSWRHYQEKLGQPMADWAMTEIGFPSGVIFYPFSGPDLVTVAQLYPAADRYVLVAMQSAWPPVDPESLPAAGRRAFYGKFGSEWQKFGQLGFFRTNDLDSDAQAKTGRIGITPVLLAFAARLNLQVVDVYPIALNEQTGDYGKVGKEPQGAWNSVRLVLKKGPREVLVDYVRMDLSDHYLQTHAAQQAWIERMAGRPLLLKAASHLLQGPGFSVLRDAIVKSAPLVVQDETGLEYGYLKRIGKVDLYGRFVRPYKIFDAKSQGALAAAYREAKSTGDLPFSFSYNKPAAERSLQVVRRPTTVASAAAQK